MEVGVDWDAGYLMARLRKLHAPRKCGRLAPATACREAALASEEVPDCDSRCTRVGSFPPRQFVTLHQEIAGEHRAEQSAIPDATGAKKIEREKKRRIVAIVGLGEEHQDLRADQSSQQHPQTQVVDFFGRQPIAPREPNCYQNRAEKRDSEKHTVGVDGEITDSK